MREIKYCPPKKEGGKEDRTPSPGSGSGAEIILPSPANATNVIPDEMPRQDGPRET